MRKILLVLTCAAAMCGCEYMTPKWGTTKGPSVQVEKVQVAAPTEKRDVETIRVRIKRAGGGVVEESVPLNRSIPGVLSGQCSNGAMVVVPGDVKPEELQPLPPVQAGPTKPKRPWWDWCGITQGCRRPGGAK